MSALSLRGLIGLAPAESHASRAQPYTRDETILVLVAALAFVGGLIHVGAAVEHWREFHLYTLVFSCFAALQATWALLLLRGASRRVLLLGCALQLGIVVLWVISRTVGVPIGPEIWTPESIGVADVIATVGEWMTVIAVVSVVFSDGHPLARSARSAMVPLLMSTILVSALFGTGAHAG